MNPHRPVTSAPGVTYRDEGSAGRDRKIADLAKKVVSKIGTDDFYELT
jgi:hypothetical protein